MKEPDQHLRTSANVMRVVGWGLIVGGPILFIGYPPGMAWGELPAGFPLLGPPHPVSPHNGLHPYLFMIFALYAAWAILLIRGAKDPRAAASLFDWGILANLLHGALMLVQAFIEPNEHAHLWTDVPLLFALSAVMWWWHPNRANAQRRSQ
jgi:Family of unknown function (DUF6632)